MALTTISALYVKEKALRSSGVKPGEEMALKALFMYLAQHKANPTLYFYPFADLTADVAAVDAACKLYAVYVKKQATDTDAFFKLFDDAANDATAADASVCIPLTISGEHSLFIQPDGHSLAAGAVVGSYTDSTGYNGTTPSTSGDGPDGFIIVGKP
jgi:hypothetical protein